MTGKSAKRKPRSGRHRNRNKKLLTLSGKLQLTVILICVLASWLLWLDYRIHSEFEGGRWTVPARVYARSPDIYTGQRLSIDRIEQSLKAGNYQSNPALDGPGQFKRSADALEVYLRAFHYWDGHVSADRFRIEVSAGVVTRIESVTAGADVPLLRLEPELIGKIYPDHKEDRILVEYREVPQFLVEALVAVEDRYFFRHSGIDFRGILRAFQANLSSGRLTQGGSTLTQQLVKNFFLTRDRTFSRKVNEMIMAMLLERRYTKQEILSAYINEVYLGQHGDRAIHGFGTAAEFYFRKPLPELRDDQIALLVGMARGASYYNPVRHPQRALSRRNLVLELMNEQDYLDDATSAKLEEMPVEISARPGWVQSRYPAFIDFAKRQLLEDYRLEDLKNEGLRIYTTLDPQLQDHSAAVTGDRLRRLEDRNDLPRGALETAVISVNTATGEVLALSGGRHSGQAGFNRAVDAARPLGSLIKPFIYLTALSAPDRYQLLSVLHDEAVTLKQPDGSVWQPGNYDRTFHGEVSLLESMVNSYNLATIHLGLDTGLENIRSTLEHAGMDSAIDTYPSLLLGAVDVSPLVVAQMYQTLANGGYFIRLNTIREVLDSEGNPLQRRKLDIQQSLDQGPVYLTNYLLKQVVELGTARHLKQILQGGQVVAGKTGTTNDSRDSWFAGYDDQLLTVVWLGRDDNQPTPFTGAAGAMLVWADVMASVPVRPLTLPAPENIYWTENVELKFAGNCIRLAALPYIGTRTPENKLACQGENNPVKFRLNPFNWFQ